MALGHVQAEKASGEAYWLGAKMGILVLPAIMLGILLLGGVMLLFERSA